MDLYFKNVSQIQQLAIVLGDCYIVTGSRLDVLLAQFKFKDDKFVSTKWKRIHNGFANQLNQFKNSLPILEFVEEILNPVNYNNVPERFDLDRENVNHVLRFASLECNEKGKIISVKIAETLSEAQIRANTLKTMLKQRNAHQILFKFCTEELCNDDYFHAVQEAIKSILSRLRELAGLKTDGRSLVQQALQSDKPFILINYFRTLSEKK